MLRPANKPYQMVKDEWSREMLRLESFRHPNIVYIHDAFENTFLFYLALERCDTSLRALLGTPFQDHLLIELSRQLLMTLQYLHDNGVVHSDLHGNLARPGAALRVSPLSMLEKMASLRRGATRNILAGWCAGSRWRTAACSRRLPSPVRPSRSAAACSRPATSKLGGS